MSKQVKINNFNISNNLPITLIAGPCQLESREHSIYIAKNIKKLCDKLKVNFIYKTSFDKANRTSHLSKRGLGLDKSIKIFDEIRNTLQIPILTDVHSSEQCEKLKNSVDVIQIPAFLCRQTDLLQSAAKTNLVINIKKGQFLAPWDVSNILRKIEDFNQNILLTERGVSFGYNTLISDMRSISIMKKENYPVIFDATHSVQQPGGKGDQSGGQREFIYDLSKAAVSIGIAGLFVEVHEDPDNAPSDGPNMLKLSELENFLIKILKIDNLVKKENL